MTTTEPTSAKPAAGDETKAVAVLDALDKMLPACDRPDLQTRATAARRRLERSTCTVLVVGEFKKGKSSLINALVNAPVCPVDDDVATAKPIEVRNTSEPSAEVVYRPADNPDDEPTIKAIPFDDIGKYTSEPLSIGVEPARIACVRVGLPRQLLAGGLVLVDTPGVGGLGSTHSAATIGTLPSADAVLFVTDASQELTASEVEFLRTAAAMCPSIYVVLTKTDFYPAWRKIVELDRGHLQRAGLPDRILATSATLRAYAIAHSDRNLNAESGYAELVSLLRDELAGQVHAAAVRRVGMECSELLDHLESQLRAELSVLDDPDNTARLVRQLETAKERADRLRSQASRWQQTLNDGTTDLTSDVDFDLRARFRELVRSVEDTIDGFDPAKAWDDFEPWLYREVTTEVVHNYTFLHQRAEQLAAQVAAHFNADHREISSNLDIPDPLQLDTGAGAQANLKIQRPSHGTMAMSAMRGTSGGMVMLNAFAGLAGVALAVPFVATVGIMLGRKALKDERQRQLAQRRMQAKQAVRRYTEEVQFMVGKDTRDTLRRVNRQLRDYYLERAEELTTSTAESLAAAQTAVRSSEQERQTRRKAITTQLENAARVRNALAAIVGPAVAP
jgi:hypothetical protein